MEKSNLWRLFLSLKKSEVRELGKFVRSPYFNQREYVIRLCEFLTECRLSLKMIPEFKQAFKASFPGEAYQLSRLRHAMSLLLRLMEQFLLIENHKSRSNFQDEHLPKIYRQRNMTSSFQRRFREVYQELENQPRRNSQYFQERYQLELEKYRFSSASRHTEMLNLQELSNTLDQYYLIEKLKLACLLLSHQRVYKIKYQLDIIPPLLKYIQAKDLLEQPAIAMYYHGYFCLLDQTNETAFQNLKHLLTTKGNHFSQTEIQDLYLLAINFCIRQLNDGKQSYFSEGLELYKSGLENGYLLSQGRLSRFTYNNAVAMALQLGEYKWATTFIETYQNKLDPDFRESTYQNNLARLAYAKGEYAKALEHFNKVEYKDLLLNLGVKIQQLKIYFELDQDQLLGAQLDAMQQYIRRKKVMGYHKTNYQNIIYYIRKLLVLNRYDLQAVEELKSKINNENILTEKTWLLAQLEKALIR